MIELPYPLVIEATEDPGYFGFYSSELEGFTGSGHSVEDCLYQAKWGIEEHVAPCSEKKGFPYLRKTTIRKSSFKIPRSWLSDRRPAAPRCPEESRYAPNPIALSPIDSRRKNGKMRVSWLRHDRSVRN